MKDYQRLFLWGVTIGTGLAYQASPVNAARSLNEAASYIAALNDAKIGERNDWRLPNLQELHALIDYNRDGPCVNTDFFRDVPIGKYWTDEPDTSGGRWTVDTSTGGMISTEPSTARCFVWAVSGIEQPAHDWQMLDEGTVTDGMTGLVWRRKHEMIDQSQPNDWESRVNRVAWGDVPALCTNGWRLPTAEELSAIVDRRFTDPAIDVSVFTPTPMHSLFWTSTTARDAYQNPDLVVCVNFGKGVVLPTTTRGKAYVRLVRDSGIVPTPAPLPTPVPTPAPIPQPAPEPLPTPAPPQTGETLAQFKARLIAFING